MGPLNPQNKASNTDVLWDAVGDQPLESALAKMQADGWVQESGKDQKTHETVLLRRKNVRATLYVSKGKVGMVRFEKQPGNPADPAIPQ